VSSNLVLMTMNSDQTEILDKSWEYSTDAATQKSITSGSGDSSAKKIPSRRGHSSNYLDEILKNKSKKKTVNMNLSEQVQELNRRVSVLEDKLRQAPPLSEEDVYSINDNKEPLSTIRSDISTATKTALATVDQSLITSSPRNESIFREFRNGVLVLKNHNFAIFQCVLMLLAVIGLLAFGCRKFIEAHHSVNEKYKPFKVDGRDEYYRNEALKYKLPLHFFWFELGVVESDFMAVYEERFIEECNSTLTKCLNRYMEDVLNPTFATIPTKQPTVTPTLSPTWSPSWSPTISRTRSPTENGEMTVTSASVFSHYSLGEEWIYSAPVSAQCYMTSSDNGMVVTDKVGLQNLTLHLEEIGVSLQNSSAATDIFGMVMRMEFSNFDYMSGKIMCDLYLDMEVLNESFSSFANFDILFMVSRDEFQTGSAGITEYIRSVRKVWRRENDVIDQIYSYVFEESTFDGKSDFTAEVHLVDEMVNMDAMLNIEVYPYPTVVHYVSFERYSYVDWLADMGGFYTLAFGCFFVFSTRITKLANRRDVFQRKHGILPAISLRHRNAEELSQLRSLVLAALGITEKAYFSGDFEKRLTIMRKSTLVRNFQNSRKNLLV